MSNLNKILINKNICKSVWFMRQAGRYLPEFRKIRSQNENFIDLCLNSKLAADITLQPIERFNLDSAIIFSDILMVPYTLGQNVRFIKDQGPELSVFNFEKFLENSKENFTNSLTPVYKAIEITRKKLDKKKSVISFVGAPWTLLIYMFNIKKGKEIKNFDFLKRKELEINKIIENLIKYLCIHIENQIDAGANVVQIFDSWAGLIPEDKLKEFCFLPNAKIVDFCKEKKIPTICFPKGIKENYKHFNKFVKPNGINLDSDINPKWAKKELKDVVIQGGLDPKALLRNDSELIEEATKYIYAFKDIPYVFNLGHGLLPETDPDKVEKLIKFYRNFNG